jgi:hypothetical protein
MEPVRLAVRWKSNHALWGYATEAEARSVAEKLTSQPSRHLYSQYFGMVMRQDDLWWVRAE